MMLQDLATRIRELREKKNLKQSDIAHLLQVSPQAVSKWERGENAPDILIIADLAAILGTTTDSLLGSTSPNSGVFDASVMSTDIPYFTRKVDGMPPEDVAEYLNGHYFRITEAVLKFDAVPVKYIGDSFLCFFAGPDHCLRSVQAALRARRMIEEETIIGISSGPMFLGSLGHPDYASKDIMGDTVNCAFRINSWAGGNTTSGIGAGERTVSAIRDTLQLGKSETIELKGFGDLVEVSEVVDIKKPL